LGEEKNADDLQGTFKDKKDKISIAWKIHKTKSLDWLTLGYDGSLYHQ
jgi:hypothetical protein